MASADHSDTDSVESFEIISRQRVEVWQFPERSDPQELIPELVEHFDVSEDDCMWNSETNSFLIDLLTDNADSVLKHPSQPFFGGVIKVRRYPHQQTNCVKVTATNKITINLVKKYLAEYITEGDQIEPMDSSAMNYLVTLTSYTSAESLIRLGTVNIRRHGPAIITPYYQSYEGSDDQTDSGDRRSTPIDRGFKRSTDSAASRFTESSSSHKPLVKESLNSRTPSPASVKQKSTTILIRNIACQNGMALCFWIKSVFCVWPSSIQFSKKDKEKAVAKLPCDGLHPESQAAVQEKCKKFYGEILAVEVIDNTSILQVTVFDKEGIHLDSLATMFGQLACPDYSLADNIREQETEDKETRLYTIILDSSEFVAEAMKQSKREHCGKRLQLAEYYHQLGCCALDGLYETPAEFTQEYDYKLETPVLKIHQVNEADKDAVKDILASKKMSRGDKIRKFKSERALRDDPSCVNISIEYADGRVCAEVMEYHKRHPGITLQGERLNIELIPPTPTKSDDLESLELSGCDSTSDPDLIKYYLSALANTPVEKLIFNITDASRGHASFQDIIDFHRIYRVHMALRPLTLPTLELRPAKKITDVMITGENMAIEGIEAKIDAILTNRGFGNQTVDIISEDKVNKPPQQYRIRLGTTEEMDCILDGNLPKVTNVRRYSDHIGSEFNNFGLYTRHCKLSELFPDDELKLSVYAKNLLSSQPIPSKVDGVQIHLSVAQQEVVITSTLGLEVARSNRSVRYFLQEFDSLRDVLEDTVKQAGYKERHVEVMSAVCQQFIPLLDQHHIDYRQLVGASGDVPVFRFYSTELMYNDLASQLERMKRNETDAEKQTVDVRQRHFADYLEKSGFLSRLKEKHGLWTVEISTDGTAITLGGLRNSVNQAVAETYKEKDNIKYRKLRKTDAFVVTLQHHSFQEMSAIPNLVFKFEAPMIHIMSTSSEQLEKACARVNELYFDTYHSDTLDQDQLEFLMSCGSKWEVFIEALKRDENLFFCEVLHAQRKIHIIGMASNFDRITRKVRKFFEHEVIRTLPAGFACNAHVLEFIRSNDEQIHRLRDIESEYKIEVKVMEKQLVITGPKHQIQQVKPKLKDFHDDVRIGTFKVSKPADIQHIEHSQPQLLEEVGKSHNALLRKRLRQGRNFQTASDRYFSVLLPSGCRLELRIGDITAVSDCDAIVNAANGQLNHAGGVAKAIVLKGGRKIHDECKALLREEGRDSLQVGEVRSTTAGNLPCKRVIHAVGPRWKSSDPEKCKTDLFVCVGNCFDQLIHEELVSIAIPPISTGIYGFPLEQAIPVIINAILDADKEGSLPAKVVLIDNKDSSLQLYRAALIDAGYTESRSMDTHDFEEIGVEPLETDFEEEAGASGGVPGPLYPTSTVPSPNTAFITKLSDRSFRCNNGTVVNVITGDLTKQRKGVWINSSLAPSCQLANSPLGKAMLDAAGQNRSNLEFACEVYKGGVKEGDVVKTDSYNELCQEIVHCIRHQEFKSRQAFIDLVQKCLRKAERYDSVAMPAIGGGELKYPLGEIARGTIDAIIGYVCGQPTTTITDITITVFPKDKLVLKAFEEQLATMFKHQSGALKAKQHPGSSDNDMELSCGTGKVRIVEGDLIQHDVNLITCTTNKKFNGGGILYQKLLKMCTGIASPRILPGGKLAVYDAQSIRNVKWDSILCIATPEKNVIDRIDNSSWSGRIESCLYFAMKNKKRSVAFPALATGGEGFSAEETAGILVRAIVKFLRNHPQCGIERVDIVLFQQEHVQAYKTSLNKMKHGHKNLGQAVKDAFSDVKRRFSPKKCDAKQRTHVEDTEFPTVSRDPISVDIYASSDRDIQKVKQALEQKLEEAKETIRWEETYPTTTQYISNLTQQQVEYLKQRAYHMGVDIKIDTTTPDLVMTGLKQTVYKGMTQITIKELQKAQEAQLHEANAKLQQNTVQWAWRGEEGEWIDFDFESNKEIEDKFEIDDHATFQLWEVTDDCEASKSQIVKLNGNEGGTIGPYALRRHDKTGGPIGEYWESPLDVVKRVKLYKDSLEYQVVTVNFTSTIGDIFSGAMKSGKTAEDFEILEIERVQNPSLLEHYKVSLGKVSANRKQAQDKVELSVVWHGTSEQSVTPIVEGDNKSFERGLTGSNIGAKLGNGNYFATNSGYSCSGDQYCKQNDKGERFVIQCRVIVGKYCQGKPALPMAPLTGDSVTDRYDSVTDVDLGQGDPNIIVSFHDSYAYPEYVIKFKRHD